MVCLRRSTSLHCCCRWHCRCQGGRLRLAPSRWRLAVGSAVEQRLGCLSNSSWMSRFRKFESSPFLPRRSWQRCCGSRAQLSSVGLRRCLTPWVLISVCARQPPEIFSQQLARRIAPGDLGRCLTFLILQHERSKLAFVLADLLSPEAPLLEGHKRRERVVRLRVL